MNSKGDKVGEIKLNWAERVSDAEAIRRAGGRRRYNAERRRKAEERRAKVLDLLREGLGQSEIARRLGVSAQTISRDVWALRERIQRRHRCPLCGAKWDSKWGEWVLPKPGDSIDSRAISKLFQRIRELARWPH